NIRGDRIEMKSIDLPVSFYTTAVETLSEHEETYRVFQGEPHRVRDVQRRPEVRFLDTWMNTARKSRSADALQRKFRALYPEASLLEEYRRKNLPGGQSLHRFRFSNGAVQFVVQKRGVNYRVVSVEH